MKRLSLALALLLATAACAQTHHARADDAPMTMTMTQDQAAQAATEALGQLVHAANFAAVGFETPAEPQEARAGTPFVRRTLGYDRLVASRPGMRLEDLLEPQEQALYPVEVAGTPRTSFLLERSAGGWRIVTIGDGSQAATLRRAKELRDGAAQVQVVDVPGLNLEFLQVSRDGATSLVATRDLPELSWKAGESRGTEEGLSVLVAYARRFEELYGEQIRARRLVK